MAATVPSLNASPTIRRLLSLGEPMISLLESAREAFTEFDRECERTHPCGNMDYLRGHWHRSVRDILVLSEAMGERVEYDQLAFAQELRDHFKQ